MDQIKIGKFIASLRKQKDLTQKELGDVLGVTDKTVSRWENGNYMPDIEMLQLLSKEFGVSINDLLSGEVVSNDELRNKADENIVAVAKSSAFSLEERKTYLKKKWRKEHVALFVILGLVAIAAIALPFVFEKPWLACFSPLIMLFEYGFLNNRMMAYVEHRLFD